MWYLLALFGTLACFIVAVKGDVRLDPDKAAYPINGTKFVLHCFIKIPGGSKAEDGVFTGLQNIRYQNSSDFRMFITVSKDDSRAETNLTLTWNPIYSTDITENDKRRTHCKRISSTIGHQIIITVIPRESVPKISLGVANMTSVKKGARLRLYCEASIAPKDTVESVSIIWKFRSIISKEMSSAKSYPDDPSYANATLVIEKAEEDNEGKYFCIAALKLSDAKQVVQKFYKVVDVAVTFDGGNTDPVEKIVKAGNNVVFNCRPSGIPAPVITWEKGGIKLSANTSDGYSFSPKTKEVIANRNFTIKDVTYKDRGVYKCVATFPSKTRSQKFTLRVRDPLGALWPFIGIVVEVLLLILIIVVYEWNKGKKHPKKTEDDAVDHATELRETSPLVTSPPQVSYTTGEDNVRARIPSDEKA